LKRNPIDVSATATIPISRIGRHLGDGSLPVGKKSNMNASEGAVTTKTHPAIAPTMSAAGNEPGYAIPRTAYASVADRITNPRPTPWSSQPMRFRARRTISAPSVA
jgi:hypothetical protein